VAVLGTEESARALLEQRLAEAHAQWQGRVAARQAVLDQARQAAEAICRRLFAHASGQPGTMTLDELIDTLQAKQIIPPHVVMPLRTIQSYGTSARYPEEEHIELPDEWGAPGLYALAHVTNWYFTDYRGGAMPEAFARERPKHARPAPPLIDGRYRDLGDGTVLDTQTDLQWMRCALGQRWDRSTCVGEADKLTWDEMFMRIDAFNSHGGFAGHRDWRMPTIDELKTLIIKERRRCFDEVAFPNCPNNSQSVVFWSCSRDSYYCGTWNVSFDDGDVHYGLTDDAEYVRLVRAGQ
jgi:hypothetical protein